jgi:putative membrane protein
MILMQESTDKLNVERLLILCVDRDNDVGRKTEIKTPIIGKKENLDSAIKLVLSDPEEADANTMFEAVRLFQDLGQKDESGQELCQVATIAGSELGGVAADRKLVSELTDVLKQFPADSLILVTDGFADEDIIPLIQSRIPVTSVRRVVMKHSESLEETAAVFSRYLKTLIENPRYSKIALGLPGILLIALGVLVFLQIFIQFDIYMWAVIVALIIMGSYLFGKGYGIDRIIGSLVSRAYHASISELVANFTLITGIILIVTGFYQAWDHISITYNISFQLPLEIGMFLELLPQIMGSLISKSITLVIIGICIVFLGRSVGYLLESNPRFWRTAALVVICAWSWTIFSEISEIILNPSSSPDHLVVSIVVGIIIIVSSGVITHLLSKRYKNRFKGKMVLSEEETKED